MRLPLIHESRVSLPNHAIREKTPASLLSCVADHRVRVKLARSTLIGGRKAKPVARCVGHLKYAAVKTEDHSTMQTMSMFYGTMSVDADEKLTLLKGEGHGV